MSANDPHKSDLERAYAVIAAKNDASTACKTCCRTSVDVRMEELQSYLFPYKACSGCGLVRYYHRDPDKKELAGHEKWTVLAELTHDKKWEEALQRLALYPKEAERVCGVYDERNVEHESGSIGEFEHPSALFHAVNLQAPLELVKKLALAKPNEICKVFYNYLETHYMWDGDLDIDKKESPLQLAVSKAKQSEYWVEAAKAMLEIYLESTGGRGFPNKIVMALKLAWEGIDDFVISVLSTLVDFSSNNEIFHVLDDGLQDEWKRGWEVLTLLYRAAHFKCLEEGQSILHAIACIGIECPEDLLDFAIKMYPRELEKYGGSILHSMVAHSRRPTILRSGTDKHPLASDILDDVLSSDEESDGDENEDSSIPFKTDHIDMLLNAYPRSAAIYSHDCLLPLHLAIQARRKWYDDVAALVSAFPDGLRRRDPNGLYPFMLAASFQVIYGEGKEKEDPQVIPPDQCHDEENVDLIYNLLRTCPDVCTLGDSKPSIFKNDGGAKRKR